MSLMPAARWQEAGNQQLERSLDVKADRGSTAIRREGCSWVTKATAAPYRPNFAPATLIGQGRLCSGLTTRPNIGYEQSQQLDS